MAKKHEVIVELKIQPGDFIYESCQIAEVFKTERSESNLDDDAIESLNQKVRNCLIVGPNRTPSQDIRYAFNELVEIAVRALSPGINDPYTAISCIDRIQAALLQVQKRKTPNSHRRDEEGDSPALRLIAYSVTLTECIDESLGMIEGYVDGNPKVKSRLQQAYAALEHDTNNQFSDPDFATTAS